MRIEALAVWDLLPGRLIELRPTAAAAAAAAVAVADDEPGSVLQENHLRSSAAAAAEGRVHTAYLGAFTIVDGAVDAAAMCRALARFVDRHGGLRTRFTVDGARIVRHRIPGDAVAFEAHGIGTVDHDAEIVLDATGWRGTHQEFFTNLYSAQANALRWPGFAFGFVDHGDQFTMFLGIDHAISDGVSQTFALNEIHEFYLAESQGLPLSPYTAHPTDSFIDYARIERAETATLSTSSPDVAELIEIYLANGGGMPRFALDLGLAPGETAPWFGVRQRLLDDAEANAFESLVTAAGFKVPSALYALLATLDREIAGRRSYFGINVVSSRSTGNFMLSQGWFCHFATVAFEIGETATFLECLSHAHQGYRRARRLASVSPELIFAGLLEAGVAPSEIFRSPNMVSYIDFRQFPANGSPAYDNGMQFTGEGRTSNASLWVTRESDGLYAGSQTPDTPVANSVIARYFTRMVAVLRDIVDTGDHRITDVDFDTIAEISFTGTARGHQAQPCT
ncbi:condensation domain-containing protein [Williamsia sp. CHRR-6]|uniref:condensation domain-containing protein n=1 Tax=Williamsia sp. CHRR-6 TaxID=2835871 RepID=UPI001BDB4DFD|nr:condensation domain-containing protein [Williamsia sp. CHRR-6]MBT0566865.1 peptide synthase [Williamsia sp. CHRR-6]